MEKNNNMSHFVLKYQDKYGYETAESFFCHSEYALKVAYNFCKNFDTNVEIWHHPDYDSNRKLTTIFKSKPLWKQD